MRRVPTVFNDNSSPTYPDSYRDAELRFIK
jgi:hypothetical protein